MPSSADSVRPVSLKRTSHRSLEIHWSDGSVMDYPYRTLRDACPCATCREKHRAKEVKPKNLLSILSAEETIPLELTDMRPVGNYAYNIAFSDKHTSGLFTTEYLREIGVPVSGPTSSTEG